MSQLKQLINNKSKEIVQAFHHAIQIFDTMVINAINELDDNFIKQI